MKLQLSLESLRSCLEGVIPSAIATVAPDGTPNITLVSQVHYVDQDHVALSFQFFNKTRENILANPYATVQVVDPNTAAHYRFSLRYLRTEDKGALFEGMKAKLSGIASHTGMSKVFKLLGADIYEVLEIEGSHADLLPCVQLQYDRLGALRAISQGLKDCLDLEVLFDELLNGLQHHFDIKHAILLMHDHKGKRLYTVASRGYEDSGIGSEIPLGAGVIGVAALERTPIRIMYMTGEYAYNCAVRDNIRQALPDIELEMEIPFPGLAHPHSQLAVPVMITNDLLGVLYVESTQDLAFSYEDEDALSVLANQLASIMRCVQDVCEFDVEQAKAIQEPFASTGPGINVRYYQVNNSIFIDDNYLIKGVAGAIFWKLLNDYTQFNRVEFSNRELRLDTSIGLPELSDNLEARLILLQKRLKEHCDFIRIEKAGRGRLRMHVDRALQLELL